MLKLDSYSEDILLQCDRCKRVGEIAADVREWEGAFYCWSCLSRVNSGGKRLEEKVKTLSLN